MSRGLTDDPKQLGAKCDQCPLAAGGNPRRPVYPRVPTSPVGILVGDAPRGEDTEAARPFSGQTGSALADSFEKAGLGLDKLVHVNAVACEPPTKKDWQHLGAAVECCRPFFVKTVKPYAHLPALLMGKWAFQAWSGRAKAIDNARGFIRDIPLRDKLDLSQTKDNADDAGRSESISPEVGQSDAGPELDSEGRPGEYED